MGKSRQPKSKRKAPAKVAAPPVEKPKSDKANYIVALINAGGAIIIKLLDKL